MDTLPINVTELEARALFNAITAILETTAGATIKARMYDWQLEAITELGEKSWTTYDLFRAEARAHGEAE